LRTLQSYLITDPYLYNSNFVSLLEKAVEKHTPNYICFRDKLSPFQELKKYAKTVLEIGNYYKIPTLVNTHLDLLDMGFDGVHLNSSQLSLIDNFRYYITFASTHSEEEVKKASNSDYITFSPIYNSKGRKGLGIQELNRIATLHKGVFALGGIVSDREVNEIREKSCAKGFASIRYFFQN